MSVPTKQIDIETIIDAACKTCGVTLEQVISKKRPTAAVRARTIAVYLARRHTILSFPDIAWAMRRPNHSTPCTQWTIINRDLLLPDGHPTRKAWEADIARAEAMLVEGGRA